MPKYKFLTPKNNNISLLYDFKTKNLTDYIGLFFVIDDLYFRNSTNMTSNNIVGIKHEVCDGQMNRENIFEKKN